MRIVVVGSTLWQRIRMKAILLLAGDMQVFVNTNVHEGRIFFKEGAVLMGGSFTFIGNTFIAETPEMQQMTAEFLTIVEAETRASKASREGR